MRKRKAMKGDSTLTFGGNTNGRSRPFSRPWSSLHCIIPPHMLESIAMRGTEEQRAVALETLAIDQTFRSMRAGARMLAPPRRGQPGLTAEECAIHRTIYDAHHAQSLPGSVVRTEGQPATGDASVDEAYDGLGSTFDFYWATYQRCSIDDEGMPLNATVHFGNKYNNAYWNGQQMVFGDGDGKIFNRFTISIDVIGHELTHGVTEDEAGLVYYFQPGALNESVSDVFGSLVKQYVLKQRADKADWLIGAGLFTPQVHGVALRSMKAPGTAYDDPLLGKDPQPAHMSHFVHTWRDNGGVHINSGIPNHAFYLTATQIGGYSWDKAGRIWYEALRDPALKPTWGFRRFARLTVNTAGKLYGGGSAEQKAVHEAWSQVGIVV